MRSEGKSVAEVEAVDAECLVDSFLAAGRLGNDSDMSALSQSIGYRLFVYDQSQMTPGLHHSTISYLILLSPSHLRSLSRAHMETSQ